MASTFQVDVPKMFGIPITDKCHLRCVSCFNTDERFETAKHMDIKDFKRIVNWVLDQGIEYVDLTPTVGEALLIPNLSEYLDYLDESDIKKYTLITTLAHKNVGPVLARPKLVLEVSLYGGNKEQYKEYTQRDVFSLVRSNILKAALSGKVNVLKRFKGPIDDARLKVVTSLANVEVMDFSEDRGLNIGFNGEVKKCKFMNEPLLTPNGISLCCIDYNYTDFIIGHIGDDLEDVYADIECTIRERGLRCSTACDWYSPWKEDRGLDR